MNEKAKFLFFCMIFVGSDVFAQKKVYSAFSHSQIFNDFPVAVNTIIDIKKLHKIVFAPAFVNKPFKFSEINSGNYINGEPKIFAAAINNKKVLNSPLPQNFYTQNLGFFCKKELQLEKATKIPFKFRLGSVQQCDWMEGKVNTGIKSF